MFKKPLFVKISLAVSSILIITLAVVVGLLLKDRSNNSNNLPQTEQTSTSRQTQQEPEEPIPTGYIRYKSENLGFKFNYPKEWGSVNLEKKARNREDYEPTKTYNLSFSQNPNLSIKISPNNWSFTGGEGDWDFPVTTDEFNRSIDETSELSLVQTSNSYLRMSWNGLSGTVELKGAKKVDLSKISASFVEFSWNSVDETCAADPDPTTGARKAQLSCYNPISVAQTKTIIEGFKAL
jgi:hypothetical protein